MQNSAARARGSYCTVRANEHQLRNDELLASASRLLGCSGLEHPSETLAEIPLSVMRLPLCCMTPAFSIATTYFEIKHSI